MTQHEQDALIQRFMEALDARRSIDEKMHAKHHQFIDTLIDQARLRQERWEAVKTHIAKWGAVGLISACLLGLSLWAKHKLMGG